jgi:hypothetical protein
MEVAPKKEEQVRVMHLRRFELQRRGNAFGMRVAQTGGVTVAFRQLDNAVEIAIARCSRNDVYNKKLGRTIATGRLQAGQGIMLQKSPLLDAYSTIYRHLSSRKSISRNFRM